MTQINGAAFIELIYEHYHKSEPRYQMLLLFKSSYIPGQVAALMPSTLKMPLWSSAHIAAAITIPPGLDPGPLTVWRKADSGPGASPGRRVFAAQHKGFRFAPASL